MKRRKYGEFVKLFDRRHEFPDGAAMGNYLSISLHLQRDCLYEEISEIRPRSIFLTEVMICQTSCTEMSYFQFLEFLWSGNAEPRVLKSCAIQKAISMRSWVQIHYLPPTSMIGVLSELRRHRWNIYVDILKQFRQSQVEGLDVQSLGRIACEDPLQVQDITQWRQKLFNGGFGVWISSVNALPFGSPSLFKIGCKAITKLDSVRFLM